MKNKFQTLIILLLCFGVFTTVLKPKKVEAIALSSAIAGVTAVALVGVLGYNLVMPKDKQIDVSGQLTGLFNKAKEWADGLPDWLYYSEADFENDLGSPTGVGTLSKDNLRGVSSMIKDYLGSRGSFYLDGDLNIVDTSNLLNSDGLELWKVANNNNVGFTMSNLFTSGQTLTNNGNLFYYSRYENLSTMGFGDLNFRQLSVIDSNSSIPNHFVSIPEQYTIPDMPEGTLRSVSPSSADIVTFDVSNGFDEVIGDRAFAGYEYDSNGYITYKYQIINANDRILFDRFAGNSAKVRQFPVNVVGIYEHYGTHIRYFNTQYEAFRTLSLPIDVGVNALFTVRSLQEYVLNNVNDIPNSIRFEKTMVIDNDIFENNVESIPTNQNGAIAIPQVPQFETDKEIGGFPLIDDINKILDGSGSGTGSGDLPIDNTDTLPKDTSFPTYPDILPFPDLSLHNVLSTDFFAQLFAWLGSVLTSPFVWLGSVINWAVTKLVLLFQTLIKALFMPTTTIDNFINLINAKFPIIGQVSDLVNSLINGLNINSERPRFAIQYYGTHDIIDFAIVDPYIGIIKGLISFLLSFKFVKWLVGYIPKLLGGV